MADSWGVSWGGTFIVWGAGVDSPPPAPVYGAPFVTVTSPMKEFISKRSKIIDTISRRSEIDENE